MLVAPDMCSVDRPVRYSFLKNLATFCPKCFKESVDLLISSKNLCPKYRIFALSSSLFQASLKRIRARAHEALISHV